MSNEAFVKPLLALAALFLASLAAHAPGQDLRWWNKEWSARRNLTLASPTNVFPQVVHARFWTMSLARKDGADIRVVDEQGAPLNHKIMLHAGGVETVVAFELTRRGQQAWAYFGNPKAETPAQKWEPRAGLFLETRHYDGKPPNTLDQMQRILLDYAKPYGGGYRRQIFDAYNPYGASDCFISIYTGYFHAPTKQEYAFATVSADASFVLVDGQLVCQWPGAHPPQAGRFGEFRGSVTLTPGPHKLEYLHVASRGGPVMELARWLPDSKKKIEVVPETFFLPILTGRAGDLQLRDTQNAADFDIAVAASLPLDEPKLELVACRFSDRSGVAAARVAQAKWDFGDGLTSTERSPTHVYVGAGDYDVVFTLELKGAAPLTARQRLSVSRRDDADIGHEEIKTRDLVAAVAQYPLARLSDEKLRAMVRLFAENELHVKCVEAGTLLLKGRKEAVDTETIRTVVRTLTEKLSRPDEARALLTEAVSRANRRSRQVVELLLDRARIELDYSRDASAALRSLQETQRADAQATQRDRWTAAVIEGDCYRLLGDYAKALAAYRRAESIDRPPGSAGLHRSSYNLSVESYLNSNELDAARAMLVRWEDEYPTERLYGLSSLLRARYYDLTKETPKAIALLETMRKANPESPCARETADLLATLYAKENKTREALAVLESLQGLYDDAAFNRVLQQRIDACRQRLGLSGSPAQATPAPAPERAISPAEMTPAPTTDRAATPLPASRKAAKERRRR